MAAVAVCWLLALGMHMLLQVLSSPFQLPVPTKSGGRSRVPSTLVLAAPQAPSSEENPTPVEDHCSLAVVMLELLENHSEVNIGNLKSTEKTSLGVFGATTCVDRFLVRLK